MDSKSKLVDQYAGRDDDVRRYLTAMPTAAAEYFGPSLELCQWRRNPNPNGSPLYGARLEWTSTSAVTFESGRIGRLAVATVVVSNVPKPRGGFNLSKVFGLSDAPNCLGLDKVAVDSFYVNYIDPDGYSWSFAIHCRRNSCSLLGRRAWAEERPRYAICEITPAVPLAS